AGYRQGKFEGPVGREGQIVTAVVLEHDRSGDPGDRTADRVRRAVVDGTHDADVGDVSAAGGALAVEHRAVLVGLDRRSQDRNAVLGTARYGGWKYERAVRRNGHRVRAVLQHQPRPGQTDDDASDRIARRGLGFA